MTHLKDIEDLIVRSFKLIIKDYEAGKVINEEDMRAAFYYRLRSRFDKFKDLRIHLSYTFEGKYGSSKPDVIIFRKNTPLVVMEMKVKPYSTSKGEDDIERIKYWSKIVKRGYFIHIDGNKRDYNYRYAKWKNHYYRELYYLTSTEQLFYYEVTHGNKYHEEI